VTGGWALLNNGELRNLYSSPNSVRVVRTSNSRWARPEEAENAYKVLVSVDTSKIWILVEGFSKINLEGSGCADMDRVSARSELSCSIKGGEFLECSGSY
jgi:hypothetical protein